MKPSFTMLAVFLLAAPELAAKTRVLRTDAMEYRACLASIRAVSRKLGVTPRTIVSTGILTMVRFPTNDGSGQSLLVTCSKMDRKRVINLSE